MVTNANVSANFEQFVHDEFAAHGNVAPPNTTVAIWLPFYHDMGLLFGIGYPILGGWHTVFTTPMAFAAKPARWVQMMASYPNVLTAGPNFAFELAAGRTTDEDMAGLDLGGVAALVSGAERVHEATLRRFAQRFAKFNFHPEVLKPSYGLAEATLYVATREAGSPPSVAAFDADKLAAGHAERCALEDGTALVSYGTETSPLVRIVDPETGVECPAGIIGEIWTYGENNCLGYWRKPEQTERVFKAEIVGPTAGTPAGPWLRTGDLGVISEGELFIIGRIKDLLIVRGRNHYPDDIESTISEITGGRVAAFSVEEDRTEQLVAVIEIKKREQIAEDELALIKRDVATAVSETHGISAADLVFVPSGSIPLTTSGKVRRSSSAELYRNRQFDGWTTKCSRPETVGFRDRDRQHPRLHRSDVVPRTPGPRPRTHHAVHLDLPAADRHGRRAAFSPQPGGHAAGPAHRVLAAADRQASVGGRAGAARDRHLRRAPVPRAGVGLRRRARGPADRPGERAGVASRGPTPDRRRRRAELDGVALGGRRSGLLDGRRRRRQRGRPGSRLSTAGVAAARQGAA